MIRPIALILACCLLTGLETGANSGGDYWIGNNRVRQLASQFSSKGLEKDPGSIGPVKAAHLLHEITKDTHPLESRCELYAKLFKEPNIHTQERVASFVENQGQLNVEDIEKLDLIPKMRAELKFSSLTKLKTITTWFESEFNEITPELDAIKNDILSCIVAYGNRHLKSVSGIKDSMDDVLEKIKPITHHADKVQSSLNNALSKVYKATLVDANYRKGTWLAALKQLVVIAINYRYSLTPQVIRYLTKDSTLKFLNFMNKKSKRLDSLKNSCVQLETDNHNRNNSEVYKKKLLDAFILVSNNIDWLPKRSVSFVHQPQRWFSIQKNLIKFNELSKYDSAWQDNTTAKEKDAYKALLHSCPSLTHENMGLTISEPYDKSLDVEQANWMVERLYHYYFGCLELNSDPTLGVTQRRWFVNSISTKLNNWAIKMIQDQELDRNTKKLVRDIQSRLP